MKEQQFRKFLNNEGTSSVNVTTEIDEDEASSVQLTITDEEDTIYLYLWSRKEDDATNQKQQFLILRDALDFIMKFLDEV